MAAFTNLSIIRVYGGQNREFASFDNFASKYKDESNKADFKLSVFFVLEKTIRYISITIVVFFTALGITKGKYEIGVLVTVLLYGQRFYSPITNIIKYLQMLQKGMASVEAINSFLDTEDVAINANITFVDKESFLSCSDVAVEDNGVVILPKTDLRILDKSLNLVHGDSGSGKTTLLKALLGLTPITNGVIKMATEFSNTPIFSYASQDAEIFAGSVLDNVLYPQDESTASEKEISEARSLLFHMGFNAASVNKDVGEFGCNLSGGEKRRIAFIRAILTPSKILLLDEITSNLDIENESIMNKLIVSESKKRCVILVTHKEFPENTSVFVHNIGKGRLTE